jgi:signal transduction histidine kinase
LLPVLFDPAPRALSAPPVTGLGLRVAKAILDAHGGAIRVENIVVEGATKGARFRIVLPKAT